MMPLKVYTPTYEPEDYASRADFERESDYWDEDWCADDYDDDDFFARDSESDALDDPHY